MDVATLWAVFGSGGFGIPRSTGTCLVVVARRVLLSFIHGILQHFVAGAFANPWCASTSFEAGAQLAWFFIGGAFGRLLKPLRQVIGSGAELDLALSTKWPLCSSQQLRRVLFHFWDIWWPCSMTLYDILYDYGSCIAQGGASCTLPWTRLPSNLFFNVLFQGCRWLRWWLVFWPGCLEHALCAGLLFICFLLFRTRSSWFHKSFPFLAAGGHVAVLFPFLILIIRKGNKFNANVWLTRRETHTLR